MAGPMGGTSPDAISDAIAGEVLTTKLDGPLSAFGEVRISPVTPLAQIDAVYGIQSSVEVLTDPTPGTGSVTVVDGNFTCQTGTGLGGYGVCRSRRAVRYRSGQGALFRFTAYFDTANAVALSFQGAGAFNSVCGFFVGYNGADFGTLHETGGAHEIRVLTLSAGASGAETANLTLDGTLYAIPVTSGTVQHNAAEIAIWMAANQAVWDATQNDDTVVLFRRNVGPAAGAYSLVSAGTLGGTIAQTTAGVVTTKTWDTTRSGWLDPLDGTGGSGMVIDPSKLNVFELDVQYLGAGMVTLKIEDPTTGQFIPFYQWQFPNSRTIPTMTNPTLKVGWAAASLGSTTNITMGGASAMGGIDGKQVPLGQPDSFDFQRSSVGATLTPIFSIRVRSVFDGVAQLSEVLPLLGFVAPAGTKPCKVEFLYNPTFTDEPDWQYQDEATSIVEYDTTAVTLATTGRKLVALAVSGGGQGRITARDLQVSEVAPAYLQRGDILTIAASISTGSGSDVLASLTWVPD